MPAPAQLLWHFGARKRAAPLYALSNFSATSYYATQVNGGEPGVATGFGAVFALRINAFVAASRHLLNRCNGSNAGYLPYISSANQIAAWFADGGGVPRTAPAYQLTASDLGKITVVVVWHDGAKIRLAVNRVQMADGVAITGFTPAATAQTMSGLASNFASGPTTSLDQLFHGTFRGVPSAAQLDALFDAARAAANMPTLIGGATVTHRWSFQDAPSMTPPTSLTDTVTSATVDAMASAGTPTLAAIDPATPRLWGYETTPIFRGFNGAEADYYASPGMPGSTSSFWAAMLCQPTSLAASEIMAGGLVYGPYSGWDLRCISGNLQMCVIDGAGGGINSPSNVLGAGDLGKLHFFVGVYDATSGRVRGYAKRAEVGAGTAITGHLPGTAGVRLGRSFANGLGSVTTTIYSYAYGTGLPTNAEVLALFDAVTAQEKIPATGIPGKTTTVIDLAQDFAAGTAPASLVDRAGGPATFARTGAPVVRAQYARSWA